MLEGGKFALYAAADTNFSNILQTAESGEDGVAVFEGVPLGSYAIKEIQAPAGYYISGAVAYATISRDGQTVTANPATISDTPYIGNIKVLKTATDGTKLSGATFKLYLADDTKFNTPKATAVSDSNGIALFQGIPYGSYAIRETSAPSGYYINSTILYVKITTDGSTVSAGALTNSKIPESATSPKTGDNILNYALVMGAAAVAAVVIYITRNRKKNSKYTAKH